MRNLRCLATLQSTATVCPLISPEQKLWAVKKAPIWSQRERLHCSPSLHLSSPTPSSCCAGLAARRGFLFWFLCWRSKFPGMWNQRRCCHVSPPSFFNPSQKPLWDGEQRISSSMRNGVELQARNPMYDARTQACERASTCAAADDFMHTHPHTHLNIAQYSLFIYFWRTWVLFGKF